MFITKNELNSDSTKSVAKNYLFSAFSIFLSFAFKIVTGVLVPFIILYSFLDAKKSSKNKFLFWKVYFLWPLTFLFGIYFIFNLRHILTYYLTQKGLEDVTRLEDLRRIWDEIYLVFPFFFFGVYGMIIGKEFRKLLLLSFGLFSILAFHLVFRNAPSLDKHTFLIVCFMAIIADLGIVNILNNLKKGRIRSFLFGNTLGAIVLFWIISFGKITDYNHLWINTDKIQQFMRLHVKSGDRVLAETGASIILASSENDFPTNISTFDWFVYGKSSGLSAYAQALNDGYFQYVELEDSSEPKLQRNSDINFGIQDDLEENYKLIYKKEGFLVYQRRF